MSYFDERIGDIPYLKELARAIKEDRMDFEKGVEWFFHCALLPYYQPIDWDGMNIDAGHIIYRLSDFLPEEKRSKIEIYPNPHGGSLIINDYHWDSLEDWRKQWEKYHSYIPPIIKKLPASFDFLK
jgi:hypothetical protein